MTIFEKRAELAQNWRDGSITIYDFCKEAWNLGFRRQGLNPTVKVAAE